MEQAQLRIKGILAGLKKAYPRATCALNFSNPLELLIATILSAQCTDERVNKVTPALFRKYRAAQDFARAALPMLEKEIHSTGFYTQKARWIKLACQKIVTEYGGNLPPRMEDLLTLTGVARKTANVVLGTAFDIASGIAVDTHVKRLSGRMGLSKETDPNKIEQDLMALVKKTGWVWFGHAMIAHGRHICTARVPQCPECPVEKACLKIGL